MSANPSGQQSVVCQEMCYYCFNALESYWGAKQPMKPSFTNDPYPLFVTWTAGPERELRGCIGTFSPTELHYGLKHYAKQSAFCDNRFSKITQNDLPGLNVSVSVLTNFEEARGYLDWQIGTHGIKIEFRLHGVPRSATYLPEVAPEQGWDRIETIDSLLRKAGHNGPVTSDLRDSIKLTRYQSQKLTVTYQDYYDWCQKNRA